MPFPKTPTAEGLLVWSPPAVFILLERCDFVVISRYLGSRSFLKGALLLTLPILFQNLLTTSTSLVDTLMISSLGTVELTAVGLAASWLQLLNVFLFGITSAAGVLVAQFWGGGEHGELRRSYGGGFVLSLLITLVFTVITMACPRLIMTLYSGDPEVIEAGAVYLGIVALGFPAFGLQFTANAVLRSTEQVRIPMYGTVLSVLTNIFLNWVLIFGNLGAPRLELAGAAIASVVGNWLGAGLTYALAFWKKTMLRSRLSEMLAFDRAFVRRYFFIAWPIMVNEMLWGGGTAVLNMIYGHMGTTEYAALTMCATVENLVNTTVLSLANVATVLVGKEIGRGREDRAYSNARVLSCWAPLLGAFFGALILLLRGPIAGVFQQEPEVTALAMLVMLVLAVTLPLRFFQFIQICGILRSGADGKKAAFYDFIGVWCVSVPVAGLGLLLGVEFLWVYLAVSVLDGIVKCTLTFRRFRSKKWIQRVDQA